MKISFRFLSRLALLLAGLVLGGAGLAQSSAAAFPSRPVTLLVPYTAGGQSDVIARLVNQALAKQLGQSVLVENLAGAGGSIAANKVLNAPADGYYLFQGSPNELVLAALANAAVKLRAEDFRPVQMLAWMPMAIAARGDFPASNADELAAYAVQQSKANKPVNYASVGVGSLYHLLGEQMARNLGVQMLHVPYKGGADVLKDLLGGQIDLFITPYGAAHVALHKQGRVKFIASMSPQRAGLLPDVPTVNESKALHGFVHSIWTGYFVRKDTPEPVVQALHKALVDSMADPAVRAGLEAQGLELARPQSLPEAARLYVEGANVFRDIAKSIQLQPQ